MKVLLLHELLVSAAAGTLDENGRQIFQRLMGNRGTKFLHSAKLIRLIYESLPADVRPAFQSLATRIIDSGGGLKEDELSTTIEDEQLHIYRTCGNSLLLVLGFKKPSGKTARDIQSLALIEFIKKPNFDWLLFELAMNHPSKVSVDSSDFNNDKEIVQFFENIFRIPKSLNSVAIFDRETREFNHGKFASLKNVSVSYYTLKHREYDSDENQICKAFNKLRIFVTRDRDLAHSRKIVFDGLIVISDNSLNNVRSGGDWSVDVQYSESKARMWLSNCPKYKRSYPI